MAGVRLELIVAKHLADQWDEHLHSPARLALAITVTHSTQKRLQEFGELLIGKCADLMHYWGKEGEGAKYRFTLVGLQRMGSIKKIAQEAAVRGTNV